MDIVEARKTVVIINNYLRNESLILNKELKNKIEEIALLIKEKPLDNLSDVFESNLLIDVNIYEQISKYLTTEDIYKILKSNKLRNIFTQEIIKVIWNLLKVNDQIKYFKENSYILERDNYLLYDLLNDKKIKLADIKDKVEKNSLDIDIEIDWNIEDCLDIFKPWKIVNYLNKNYFKIENIKDLLTLKIINILPNNSLDFEIKDVNKKIINKINYRYFVNNWETYDIEEMYKNTKYSNLLNALYFKDKEMYKRIINTDFKDLDDYTIEMNCFEILKNKSEFKTNPLLFCKFKPTIACDIINYYYDGDLSDLLRDEKFVNYINDKLLTLLLESLTFRGIFNYLQYEKIYSKCNTLDFEISSEDSLLIIGFLDSIKLCKKIKRSMYYKMLIKLEKDEVLKYLVKPYIMKNLNNEELINILVIKNINLNECLKYDDFKNRLTQKMVINYVNKMWEVITDLKIINNENVLKIAFDLNDADYKKTNFDDINYLFTSIYNKESLALNKSKITFGSYKAIYNAYKYFGISNILNIIFSGTKNITMEEINFFKDKYITMKKDEFFNNEGIYLKNLKPKVKEILSEYKISLTLDDLNNNKILLQITKFLMKPNSDLLKIFNRYIEFRKVNEDIASKELDDFFDKTITTYENLLNKRFEKEFILKEIKFLKIKDNIYKSKIKNINNDTMYRIKFKLLYNLLVNNSNDTSFLRSNVNTSKLINKVKKELGNMDIQKFCDKLLLPLSNGALNIDLYLQDNGLIKPNNYEIFEEIQHDIKNIEQLNKVFTRISYAYRNEEIYRLANYLLYPSDNQLPKRIKKQMINCQKIKEMINLELYFDKQKNCFYSTNLINAYIDSDCDNYYREYVKIEKIITACKKITKDYFNNKVILNKYYNQFKEINYLDLLEDLTLDDFEVKDTLFNIEDIENVFGTINIKNIEAFKEEDLSYLLNQKILVYTLMNLFPFESNYIFTKFEDFKLYLKNKEIDFKNINLDSLIMIWQNLVSNCLSDTIFKWQNSKTYKIIEEKIIMDYYASYLTNNGYLIGNWLYDDRTYKIKSIFGYDCLNTLFKHSKYQEIEDLDEILINAKKENVIIWEIIKDNKYLGFIYSTIIGNLFIINHIYLLDEIEENEIINNFGKALLKDNFYIDYLLTKNKNNNDLVNINDTEYYLIIAKKKVDSNICKVYYGEREKIDNRCFEIHNDYMNEHLIQKIKLNYCYNNDKNCFDYTRLKDFKGFTKIIFDNYNVGIWQNNKILLQVSNDFENFNEIIKKTCKN